MKEYVCTGVQYNLPKNKRKMINDFYVLVSLPTWKLESTKPMAESINVLMVKRLKILNI